MTPCQAENLTDRVLILIGAVVFIAGFYIAAVILFTY
jgi:hypothetical protein